MVLFALAVSGCSASGGNDTVAPAGNGALLVFGAVGGQPTGKILVVDEQGRQRAELDLGQVGLPKVLVAGSQRALFRIGDGTYAVVDGTAAQVRTLRVPSGVNPLGSIDYLHASAHLAVLAPDDRTAAFLADLDTGSVAVLVSATETSTRFIDPGWLAPNESTVALSDGSRTWVIPTARPSAGGDQFDHATAAAFTADSRDVLLVEQPRPDRVRLVARPVGGGRPVTLATGDPEKTPISAVTAVSGDLVTFQLGDQVLLTTVRDPKHRQVAATGVKIAELFTVLGGRQVVLADRRQNDNHSWRWSLIDVAGKKTTRLPAIDGLAPGTLPGSACAFIQGHAIGKGPYSILDIARGRASPPLDLGDTGTARPLAEPSADGCTVAIQVDSGTAEGVWVIRAGTEALRLDASSQATATVSPDGKLVYVTELNPEKPAAFILDLATGRETPAPAGAGAVWLAS